MRWLALVLLGGCSYVMGLKEFQRDAKPDDDAHPQIGGCPMMTGTVPDSDGDGLGDPCDPDPNNPSAPDCFALYEAFPNGLTPDWSSWSDTGEPWNQCGGNGMDLCSPRSSHIATLYYAHLTPGVEAISFELDIQNIGTVTDAAVEVGATVMRGTTGDVTGRMCEMHDNPATSYSKVDIVDLVEGVQSSVNAAVTTILFDNGRTFTLDWRTATGECHLHSASFAEGQVAGSSELMPHEQIAIRATHVDINVHWIAAFTKSCN